MRIASWPGFPPQSRIIPPAITSAFWLAGLRREALFALAAWGSALLSTVVKAVTRRPRPDHPEIAVVIAPLGGTSFPSGHVLTYVGTYGFFAYLGYTLPRRAAVRALAAGGLAGLVALVGPSRIHQGHHWPTDVAASYLLGSAYLIGVVTFYRRSAVRSPAVEPPADG
jgi:undecaprenyl-diphosphatase